MIHVLMNGCNGKMGQTISKLINEADDIKIIAGVDRNPDKFINDYPVYSLIENVNEKTDVVIDFSNPSALPDVLDYCEKKGIALILATTGLSSGDNEKVKNLSNKIPLFTSANLSIGINVILGLLSDITKKLHNDFDIEIIEKHHNEKKDAPSGTALMMANEINAAIDNNMNYVYDRSISTEKRSKNEIGISSLRGGSIPGEHSIIFAGLDEIIEIKHTALSRVIFAKGALQAIKFIHNKKSGLYHMQDLLKEMN